MLLFLTRTENYFPVRFIHTVIEWKILLFIFYVLLGKNCLCKTLYQCKIYKKIVAIRLSCDITVNPCLFKFHSLSFETGVSPPASRPSRWYTEAIRCADYILPTYSAIQTKSKGIEALILGGGQFGCTNCRKIVSVDS